MAKHPFIRIARGMGVAALIAASRGAAIAAAPKIAVPKELRNVRYCEVITVRRKRLTLNVDVYNTLGLNFCPAAQWAALDAKALAKQLNVTAVKLNGPRYWMIDSIEAAGASATGAIADFGGIGMVHRATLQTKLWQGTVGDKFYTPNTVRRTTVFHYEAGKPVYELISPKGEVYMMQSYSQIVDPKLSIDDLTGLGQRLKLPPGWTYRTRTLTADYALKAAGTAYVINDDLYNSYQRRSD